MGYRPRARAVPPNPPYRRPPESVTAGAEVRGGPRPQDGPPEEFKAWSVCPRCGLLAVHWLEKPHPVAPRMISPARESEEEYHAWGGQSYRRRYPAVYDREDERIYSTMRRCRSLSQGGTCQHRWGQL